MTEFVAFGAVLFGAILTIFYLYVLKLHIDIERRKNKRKTIQEDPLRKKKKDDIKIRATDTLVTFELALFSLVLVFPIQFGLDPRIDKLCANKIGNFFCKVLLNKNMMPEIEPSHLFTGNFLYCLALLISALLCFCSEKFGFDPKKCEKRERRFSWFSVGFLGLLSFSVLLLTVIYITGHKKYLLR